MSKVKKVATLSIGQGVNILVNFLFLPYMARVLSYEDYGSYGQVLLIASFAAALLSFGLPQIIYVYLSQGKEKGKAFSANVSAAVVLGVLGAFLLYLFSPLLAGLLKNEAITDLLKLYAVALLFIIPNQSINSFLIFNDRVKASIGVTILTNLVKVILVVTVIQLYDSVSLALLAIIASYVLQFLLSLYLCRKSLQLNFSKQLFYEQLQKGFPLGLTGILGTGILYMDGLMVSRFEGVNAYAIYRNGALEVPYIATIYSSIAAIILPEVAKLFSKSKFQEIAVLKQKVIMNTMALTYPILIFLLFNSSELITLYLGSKYEASAIIFAVFNLTLLIRVNDYSDILVAANKSKYILYSYVISFIANAVLNYLLISSMGMIGAAIATVLSISLLAYLQLRKSLILIETSLKELIQFKQLFTLLLVASGLASVLHLGLSSWIDGYGRLILFSIFYFPIIYLYLLKFGHFTRELTNRVLPKMISDKL